MDDTFDIPVSYKGNDLAFKARLLNFGYTHKIEVMVNGQLVVLEPDEEKNYRATIDPTLMENGKIDVDLLREIVAVIESV